MAQHINDNGAQTISDSAVIYRDGIMYIWIRNILHAEELSLDYVSAYFLKCCI